MTLALIPVDIQGAAVFVTGGEKPYVPVKPIVDALGLKWQPQHRKLTADHQRWGIIMMMIPSPRGAQNTLCMPLAKVPGFLMSIDANRVAEHLRDRLRALQEEGDRLLYEAWLGHRQAAAPAARPPVASLEAEADRACGALRAAILAGDPRHLPFARDLDRIEAEIAALNAAKAEVYRRAQAGLDPRRIRAERLARLRAIGSGYDA